MRPDDDLLRGAIRSVPDFPKPGILFRDLTPLLGDARVFRTAIDLLAAECDGVDPDKVAGLDARGFLFGAALAYRLGVGFVPVRKEGKLPGPTVSHAYDLEYGSAEFEIGTTSVSPGERIVLVDDLLATGGTAASALHLLRGLGARVERVLFVVELESLRGRDRLPAMDIRSLVRYAD